MAQVLDPESPRERADLLEGGEAKPSDALRKNTRNLPGGKKHGTKYIQSPLAGPWGGPNPKDEGLRDKDNRSDPPALLFAWLGSKGVECMSHIPLRKIYLFTLAFSIVSWLFGNEHLSVPQGFRGGCLGGLFQTEQRKSCDLWLLHLHGGAVQVCTCGPDAKPRVPKVRGERGSWNLMLSKTDNQPLNPLDGRLSIERTVSVRT